MYSLTSSLSKSSEFKKCRFIENKGTRTGGAYVVYSLDNRISECLFEKNQGGETGGLRLYGLKSKSCSYKVEKSYFIEN